MSTLNEESHELKAIESSRKIGMLGLLDLDRPHQKMSVLFMLKDVVLRHQPSTVEKQVNTFKDCSVTE